MRQASNALHHTGVIALKVAGSQTDRQTEDWICVMSD